MVYIFFAEGFEEIEAVTPVDVLRRANYHVTTVGIGGKLIKGAHGIAVECDITDQDFKITDSLTAIVLPGGMPGTENLAKSKIVNEAVDYCAANNKLIGAICAAPMILGRKGLLKGKKATIFKGMEENLIGAQYTDKPVVVDGEIVTANAAGSSVKFALKLVELIVNRQTAVEIGESIQCQAD